MGLADELRKEQPEIAIGAGQESPADLEQGNSGMEMPADLDNNQVPEAAIQAVQQEIQEKIPVLAEANLEDKRREEFTKAVSDILLSEKEEPLESFVAENKKAEFLRELDKFIVENFYEKQKDQSLDQEKLSKLLLKFYMVYLDNVNEFFAAQMAFKDASKLLKTLKKQNI